VAPLAHTKQGNHLSGIVENLEVTGIWQL